VLRTNLCEIRLDAYARVDVTSQILFSGKHHPLQSWQVETIGRPVNFLLFFAHEAVELESRGRREKATQSPLSLFVLRPRDANVREYVPETASAGNLYVSAIRRDRKRRATMLYQVKEPSGGFGLAFTFALGHTAAH